MNSVRYVGMDVHRETISVAVLDEGGRLMMQSVLATRAGAILDFVHGVRGRMAGGPGFDLNCHSHGTVGAPSSRFLRGRERCCR